MASTPRRYVFLTAVAAMAIAVWVALGLNWKPETERTVQNAVKPPSNFTPLQFQLSPSSFRGVVNNELPVYGLSLGGMVYQKEVHGLSFALMNALVEKKSGVSMSLLENSVESDGLAMFAAGGVERNNGVTVGLWNLAEHNRGLQLGLVNQVYPKAVTDNQLKPVQDPKGFGVQAGLVNYSEGKGLQFGLWNSNPKSLFHYFPIVNFAL